jgi:hypothetical protein
MNELHAPSDLAPEEREVHHVLSAVPPQALPVGFRDAVMRRVVEHRVGWEWLVAALLALPSLAYLARQLAESGEDIAAALTNIVGAASSGATNASFFIDGLTVLAVALVGVACVFAAHALMASAPGSRRLLR